jgi:hypothetical protein
MIVSAFAWIEDGGQRQTSATLVDMIDWEKGKTHKP